MADGQVIFEITADNKKAVSGIKEVTNTISTESKKWDSDAGKSASGIESSFLGTAKKIASGLAAAKVGQALLEWGNAAVQAASDLQEVQNVVDVTFGSSANKIESWAKKAGSQFGLTETQAKKFTSTLGAMMKSAGISGDEIVEMSTSLSGLAADMASFYNLDFETAFQKIRSGISGETEPLKQLGVNMSVANLEAYALSQGITKTFSSMSQGEQTMLRYKYLMQATADAQGDFARTSDGFANSQRRIQTSMESIKTSIGNVLLPIVGEATSAVAGLLADLTNPPEETLFDRLNAIDIDTEQKVANIQAVADKADGLITKLSVISGTDAGEALGKMAEGANKLDASSPSTWKGILTSLKDVDGLSNIFTNDQGAQNVEDLANALSGSSLDTTQAEAWKTFLQALSDNADAVSALTGSSVEETKKWLDGLAESVNSIEPGDADAWDRLLTTLVSGFGSGTPEGQKFIEGLAGQLLALGTDSDTAVKGLEALGFTSDQITEKQEEWLKVCGDLVKTIPGLSEVVNTETGEVKGGIGALSDYVEEWKNSQEKLARWKAFYAKKEAVQEAESGLYSLEIESGGANIAARRARSRIEQLASGLNVGYGKGLAYYGEDVSASKFGGQRNTLTEEQREYNDAVDEYIKLAGVAATAQGKYQQAVGDTQKANQELADQQAYMEEKWGAVTEAELDAGKAAQETAEYLGQSTEYWTETTNSVNEAVKALADYVKGVRDATSSSVNSTLSGFEHIDTAEKKYKDAANAANEYRKELKKTGKYTDTEIEIKVNAKNAQVTLQGLTDNLKSQIAFIEEYQRNLQAARDLGVSNEVLASLSDGTEESALKLHAIVEAYQNWDGEGIPDDIKALNEAYSTLQTQKEGFTDTLTNQKLTVDETYAAMLKTAQESVAKMDLSEEAAAASGNTVSGIAQGISSHVSEVSEAVSSILTELNKLSGWGVSIDLGSFGSFGFNIDGSHATGLDNVPFDGYLAELHQGEGILTAEENRVWQRFKNGDASSRNIDYDTLGSTMRDNVKAGGNVYLEGRVVGQVVSQIQGNSYRSLQRSGWQK